MTLARNTASADDGSGRYKVRVLSDPGSTSQRCWWLETIEAPSAAMALLTARLQLLADGEPLAPHWHLSAVPEDWWKAGAGAQPSAWDQVVEAGQIEPPLR